MASKLQGNFTQSRVPTRSEVMRGAFQDFNKSRQNILQNELYGEELLMKQQAADNADTLFKQQQEEFKRKQAQRQMGEDLYNMENSVSPVAGNVNALYAALDKKWAHLADGESPERDKYNAELDALNKSAIYDKFGEDVNSAQAGRYFNTGGRDDALVTKDALLKQIMSSKVFTAEEGDALATKELNRRFPLASAESIENKIDLESKIYDSANARDLQRLKNLKGSGGELQYDAESNTWSGSAGGGASKTVTSTGQAIDTIEKLIDKDAKPGDFSGWVGEVLGFNPTRATINRANEYVTAARKAGASDYQIAAELQGAIGNNKFFDNAFGTDMNTFVRNAKLNATKGERKTNKGGGISSAAAQKELSSIEARMRSRDQEFRQLSARIAASGIHSGATQAMYEAERPITPTKSIADIVKEEDAEKEAKKQKEQEAKEAFIRKQQQQAEAASKYFTKSELANMSAEDKKFIEDVSNEVHSSSVDRKKKK